MIDVAYLLLQGVALPALVSFVVGVLLYRYNEARRSRTDDCRALRDLVAELRLTEMRTGHPSAFDFRPLGVRRWQDAPQDVIRREEPALYDTCVTAYDVIDKINAGSADVRRRGEERRSDEGAAQRDIRANLARERDWIVIAHQRLAEYVSKRCGG